MDKVHYIRNKDGLTLFVNGKTRLVPSSKANFASILEALKATDYKKAFTLMDTSDAIGLYGKSVTMGKRRVYARGAKVFYLDSHNTEREVHGTLVDRILSDLGKPSAEKYGEALLRFMDNIMRNEVKDIRQEVYDWLMSGKTPITSDGCFLAYKKVRTDFLDYYSGKMDNSPGKIVSIKQDLVDQNRNNECSVGLHFCSLNYLSQYQGGNGKVVIVKVNPRHVYAIPRDYNHQKGRCSEYFVVGEYTGAHDKDAFLDSFIDEDTKAVAAPNVAWTESLRPSLQNHAERHGILQNGKVFVVEVKGEYVPVKKLKDGWYDISGEKRIADDMVVIPRSFETKSVRAAVKKAVEKFEKPKK